MNNFYEGGRGVLLKLCCLLLTLTIFSPSFGQSSATKYVQPVEGSITPLYLGDTIPDEFWNYKMPVYLDSIGRDSVSLADFRGDNKVLIIDFWPTWCAPCVESVLWLDSVTRAKEYKNIQFVSLCAGETEERLHAFIDRSNFQVPTLYDLSYLVNRMLTRYKGYYGVLLIKDGKLWGAPDQRTLTLENLDRIEQGKWKDLTISFLPEQEKMYFAKEIVKEVSL